MLRQRLEAEHIPLWQDRVGLEGGKDWWLQITQALVSSAGDDTRGHTVKGVPDLNFASLSHWIRSYLHKDLGDALPTLHAHL